MATTPEWTITDFIHRGPWWKNRGIRLLNIYLCLPLLTAPINGFDSSLVNGLQILPAWQNYFDHPKSKILGLISAAQVIGSIVALPLTPLISDHFGRRPTLFVGSILMLAGAILQSCSNSIGMFIGSRGLIGFGLTFGLNAAPLLITELAYPTQRGKFTSMYNASWYIGSIVSAWICFGVYDGTGGSPWSWRIPAAVQAAAPLAQMIIVWFIPESPRFLVAQGRESEAARILSRFHANGHDDRDPLVMFEMAQIRHALKLEKEISLEYSWRVLFATRGNRKRMRIIIALAIFSQWSGNGLVSYYINLILEGIGVTQTNTKSAINGGLQIWNLICAVSGAFLVDRLGRRTLFILSNTGMLIDFAIWTITTALFNELHIQSAAKATIPFVFLFYMFYDLAYTPMLVAYTLEILPFGIRAKGFAVMNFVVSLTLAFNQFVNPWALDAMGWRYYLVYCGWLIIELVFVITYVIETRGRTLEETATLFDGSRPEADIVRRGGEAATMTMTRSNARKDNPRTDFLEMQPVHAHANSEDDLSAEISDPLSTKEQLQYDHEQVDHPYYIEAV